MKTQMKVQKILMLSSLVVAALVFVYAMTFLTGNIAHTINFIDENNKDWVNCKGFVDYSQWFVSSLVIVSIVFILTVALMYVMANNSRRKYYATNYVALGLFVAMALAVVVFLLIGVTKCASLYKNDIFWQAGTGKSFTKVVNIDENGEYCLISGLPTVTQKEEAFHYNYAEVAMFFKGYELDHNQSWNFILGYVLVAIVLVDVAAVIGCTVWKIFLMKGENKLLQGSAPAASETSEAPAEEKAEEASVEPESVKEGV